MYFVAMKRKAMDPAYTPEQTLDDPFKSLGLAHLLTLTQPFTSTL